MSIYKLSATGAGGTDNGIAQLDVQFDGVITGIHGDIQLPAVANADFAFSEVSFISTNTRGISDTRGSIMSIEMEAALAGAAFASDFSKTTDMAGLAVIVTAGERLWLHIVATASRAVRSTFYMYVDDGQALPVASRRR